MPKLTVFHTGTPAPTFDHPRPDRRVHGNPLRTTHEHFLAPSGDLCAGIWSCEPGAWNIAFPEGKDEFFCVIEGCLRITDTEGEACEFGPGQAAVIPSGFTGRFEVLTPVRKYYVVLERPQVGL